MNIKKTRFRGRERIEIFNKNFLGTVAFQSLKENLSISYFSKSAKKKCEQFSGKYLVFLGVNSKIATNC